MNATVTASPTRLLRERVISRRPEALIRDLLAGAGIEIGGGRPWDIQVNDPAFYGRILRDGGLGFGESYMDGQWDCEAIDQCVTRMIDAKLNSTVMDWRIPLYSLASRAVNLQNARRVFLEVESGFHIPAPSKLGGYPRDGTVTASSNPIRINREGQATAPPRADDLVGW